MVVRVGQHVTLEGRVYHHYLAHWLEAWDRSTIVDLLSILRDVFATEPPVKYKQPPQPQYVPLLPPGFGPQTSQAMPSPRPAVDVPPPPPPKPGQIQQQQQTPLAGRYDSPPPLPPLPPEEQERRRRMSYTQAGPGSRMSQGPGMSAYRAPQSQPMAGPGYYYSPESGTPASPLQQTHGWQQYPAQHQPQPQPQPPPQQRQFSQATPTTQPIPAPPKPAAPDLLTSPFELELPFFTPIGPAPPIPPNPEKDALLHAVSKALAQTLHSNVSQSESAAHSLLSQSHSLHAAIATLQAEITSLTSLNSTLQSNTGILTDSLHRADGVIGDAQSRLSSTSSPAIAPTSSTDPGPGSGTALPPIDEILVAPTVVGKQLYDLVAEEAGIQQAIYALQNALVRGVIGVETWSRHTRGLAREAFLKRALSRKVARGLGLEGV